MNPRANIAHSENSIHQRTRNITNHYLGISEDLENQATHIVIGQVENIESKWDQTENEIYSYVRILVETFLKGNPTGKAITVKHKGGEANGIGLIDSAEPRFWKGEKVKVFLKLSEETDEFAVVGGRQGKTSLNLAASSGYSYDGIHWDAADLPVRYYINENGTPDIAGTNGEFAAVQSSFQTWEDDAGSYMDYTFTGATTRSGSSQDGYIVVSWEPIDGQGGTLAETSFWYDTVTRLLIEFDIVFDEDETWSASGEVGKFDIQNVGTHEVGHTLVLNDLYDLADSEETMYGYSLAGETKKRSLYTGDVAGVRSIYGLSTITYTIDTNPTGLQIEVDGSNFTTPYSFSWFSGSNHVVNAFSPQNGNVGTRYLFDQWSDSEAQSHTITVGANDAILTADYTVQYQLSIRFETADGTGEIYPTQIKIIGGSTNNSLLTLSSYSNIWLEDVQWAILEILWQKNNVVPLNLSTSSLSANFEWIVNCRVYPTRFYESFKDSKGFALPTKPSGFQLEFPNGTISDQLTTAETYFIQNGTTAWYSITWQNSAVVPSNASFDAADGTPTVNCLIYSFTIRVTDLFGLPILGASVSVTLPNGTTVEASTRTDGTATFMRIPQGRFTAEVSYLGQTTTIRGDVANTASRQTETRIMFSIPIILLILVPTVSACLLILIVAKRRLATSSARLQSQFQILAIRLQSIQFYCFT